MEYDDFLKKFAEQFDETDLSTLASTMIFRNIGEWSSMTALSVMAMIDNEYGVMLSGNDLNEAVTIEDLYKLVEQKRSQKA